MVDVNRQEPSLSRLERESEQTRAQLAHTVDELRTRVSPAAVKQDLKDYVRHSGEEFFHTVERRARENPLQAVAIAAGLAYPVWRIVRGMPAPILLIGAGLALARPRTWSGDGHQGTSEPGLLDQVRGKVGEATEVVKEKVGEATEALRERARQASDTVQQAVSSTAEQISGTAERLQSRVSSRVESVRAGVAGAASGTTDAMRAATDTMRNAGDNTTAALSSARDQAGEMTRRAQDSLIDAIERHPMVVGGIGLFIGALIAAAIPTSRAENRLLGDTSDELKNRARDLASQGYDRAKSAAENVYEAGKQAAEEQGLSAASVRGAMQDLSEKASTVYERATNPSGSGDPSQRSAGGQSQQAGGQSQRVGATSLDAKN